jgi:hypothetical protein
MCEETNSECDRPPLAFGYAALTSAIGRSNSPPLSLKFGCSPISNWSPSAAWSTSDGWVANRVAFTPAARRRSITDSRTSSIAQSTSRVTQSRS